MVLISMNSSSMCAGILIKVWQAILMTFSMIMLSSTMPPLLLSTWEWSSGWSPKYQVWHINQNPTIDRQLMVMFSGPKSANCKICPLLQSENVGWGAGVFPTSDWAEIFFGKSQHYIFSAKKGFRGAHQSLKFKKKWGNNSLFKPVLRHLLTDYFPILSCLFVVQCYSGWVKGSKLPQKVPLCGGFLSSEHPVGDIFLPF